MDELGFCMDTSKNRWCCITITFSGSSEGQLRRKVFPMCGAEHEPIYTFHVEGDVTRE